MDRAVASASGPDPSTEPSLDRSIGAAADMGAAAAVTAGADPATTGSEQEGLTQIDTLHEAVRANKVWAAIELVLMGTDPSAPCRNSIHTHSGGDDRSAHEIDSQVADSCRNIDGGDIDGATAVEVAQTAGNIELAELLQSIWNSVAPAQALGFSDNGAGSPQASTQLDNASFVRSAPGSADGGDAAESDGGLQNPAASAHIDCELDRSGQFCASTAMAIAILLIAALLLPLSWRGSGIARTFEKETRRFNDIAALPHSCRGALS